MGHHRVLDLLQKYWWVLGVLAALVLLGWNASRFISGYQTREAATAAMSSHEQQDVSRFSAVDEKVDENTSDVEDLRYINVRIEVGQQQIMDQLKLQREQRKNVYPSDRPEQEKKIEELEKRIDEREKLLEESYKQRPAVPVDSDSDSAENPLSSLKESL